MAEQWVRTGERETLDFGMVGGASGASIKRYESGMIVLQLHGSMGGIESRLTACLNADQTKELARLLNDPSGRT